MSDDLGGFASRRGLPYLVMLRKRSPFTPERPLARNVLASALGYLVWTAIFLGSAAAIRSMMPAVHDETGFTSNVTALSLYLALSVVASLLAGWITARFARIPKTTWVWVTALALLATGVPVQLSSWDQLPLWYNLAFLALLVPATLAGGRLGGSTEGAPGPV